jgi:hypothetical protein
MSLYLNPAWEGTQTGWFTDRLGNQLEFVRYPGGITFEINGKPVDIRGDDLYALFGITSRALKPEEKPE